MNLSWIDWSIVAASIVFIRLVSWSTRSLMRGVADFLSANRLAGRYLLTISGEMANFGVISLVAGWQAFTAAGFPTIWWGLMSAPLSVVFALTGWVFYRLRETRALTVGQFLEMRYSRKFRILAGTLCWLSGIINFGIFPAVAARFLIYFCGLPAEFAVPGLGLHVATYPALMVIDLGMALFFVNAGGQVSVMVTECAQGILAAFAYLAIAVTVLLLVPWHREMAALGTAPPGASLLNPFHTGQVKDFNVWFYVISVFISIYGYQTWLGRAGVYDERPDAPRAAHGDHPRPVAAGAPDADGSGPAARRVHRAPRARIRCPRPTTSTSSCKRSAMRPSATR